MPNLGYDQILGEHYSNGGWKVVQNQSVVAASAGTATRVWVYTDASVPAVNHCKLAVYGGSTPTGAALLASGVLTNVARGQWNSVAVNFPIVAGTSYWVALIDDGVHGVNYGLGTANGYRTINGNQFGANYANEPTATLQDTVTQGNSVSMYLEYTAGGQSNTTSSAGINVSVNIAGSGQVGSQSNTSTGAIQVNVDLSGSGSSSSPNVQGKIFCIGDSITAGYGVANAASYRGTLQDYLTIGLYDFVGPYNSTMPDPYDDNHAGVSGETIAQISSRLSSELTTYMQSAGTESSILLLAGTNNVNNDSNTTNYQGYVDAIEDMIDTVVTFDADIKIVIGELPPIDSSADARVDVFNALLLSMITTKRQTVPLLRFARHNVAIKSNANWQSQLMVDYLHPNLLGLAYMAFEWYKAILDIEFTRDQISNDVRASIIAAVRSELNEGSANAGLLMRLLNSSGTILSNHACTLFAEPVNGIISSTPSADSSPVASGTPHFFQILDRDRVLKHTGYTLGKVGTTGNVAQGAPYSVIGNLFLSMPQEE